MGDRLLKIGIIFGGRSAEHEISLISAKNIIAALDKNKYEITEISLDKNGKFKGGDISNVVQSMDVVFPVMHGTYGEDGTIQGLLKFSGVAFVGCGVLASALAMDKDLAKKVFRISGVPTAKSITLRFPRSVDLDLVEKEFGYPMFVKPANLGSSVGVSKAKDRSSLEPAISEAFKYDNKILIEEAIHGREIECSVLGNENPRASLPGEIIPHDDFYTYNAKYIDENGATLVIPAELSDDLVRRVQELAVRAFQALECEGMARVDMFLTTDEKLLINEINTIPGFTDISMYPKLWEVSGLPTSKLLDELIELAIARHTCDKKLKTTHD